jgi:hypothetical protein
MDPVDLKASRSRCWFRQLMTTHYYHDRRVFCRNSGKLGHGVDNCFGHYGIHVP